MVLKSESTKVCAIIGKVLLVVVLQGNKKAEYILFQQYLMVFMLADCPSSHLRNNGTAWMVSRAECL